MQDPINATRDDNSERDAVAERITEGVRLLLSETLRVPADAITPDSLLEDDLGMDSLKMIETNVALETRYRFVSPDVARPAELDIATVRDLVGYVADLIVTQRGARDG